MSIFNLDSPFFRFMTKVADVIILGMIALLFCVPVITIVPTITAVYYVMLKTVRDEEGYLVRSFLKSFKLNFKQGVIIELFFIAFAFMMYVDLRYFYVTGVTGDSQFSKIAFAGMLGVAFLGVITFIYVLPVLARFENKVINLLRNSLFMAVKHLPYTIAFLLITALAGFIVYVVPILILFIISIWAFACSYLFVRVFDNYIPKDDRDPDEFTINMDTEDDISSKEDAAAPALDEEAKENDTAEVK